MHKKTYKIKITREYTVIATGWNAGNNTAADMAASAALYLVNTYKPSSTVNAHIANEDTTAVEIKEISVGETI